MAGRVGSVTAALGPRVRRSQDLAYSIGYLIIMKKIKGPWYGILWIGIWTAGLVWFLTSGRFDRTESIGLVVVWAVLVGITVYLLIQHLRFSPRKKDLKPKAQPVAPSLNGPCPCGSGKKFKRCCGGGAAAS